MLNKTKTRFDYDNPETCYLALDYIEKTKKCPECMAEIQEKITIEDDFLIIRIECPMCKLNFEAGHLLDNSRESNRLRKDFGVKPTR
jgi:hypothetical protein